MGVSPSERRRPSYKNWRHEVSDRGHSFPCIGDIQALLKIFYGETIGGSLKEYLLSNKGRNGGQIEELVYGWNRTVAGREKVSEEEAVKVFDCLVEEMLLREDDESELIIREKRERMTRGFKSMLRERVLHEPKRLPVINFDGLPDGFNPLGT